MRSSCSSAGTEPSSTLPKNGGATMPYHAFPRHLSRTCLVLVDKGFLLPSVADDSQAGIKMFSGLRLFYIGFLLVAFLAGQMRDFFL